ncbi:prephenate dehydratase [Paenibacillus alvei]|uniref:Prephenate dehydratase n=1 Tax=Paenibacillus alvei TaxID=44250 RepID=A0AAP7A1J1_PAEAL|nr:MULTISPECIES: prephenate dehydratase [Paenibacillus]EJW17067.1 prephenate dehydratase PheA [Paenibacillus alvei DSM 29]MCY7485323.1 prephenate dehydratase [Paenibacillus alvei]MCY9542723.1 prephenate dehydratase [Paenibacillus alvei]MCY9707899.1 prephenate dehydratase [Paenibacillus alvei]MCY9736631.1 prephenate dehydratase [Paenibacillus alvei]
MARIALLPEGSVSHEAALHLAGKDHQFVHYKLISDVFLSTARGDSDYSVIPIENTIEGSVNLHMDWIVHEVDLPFQAEWVYPSIQNLVGRQKEVQGDWSNIQKIMSHPVAMAQCMQYIRTYLPHAELEHVSSTAEAIRIVKQNPDRGWAAIGTTIGAQTHGLDILAPKVTDHQNNFTRFVLIGKKPLQLPPSAAQKTTILVTLPEDFPGALHQVLSAFAWRRINLSRIESRPTKRKLGSYYFYIDVEMALDTVLLPAAIEEIEAIGCQVRILGTYPSYSYEFSLAD